MSISSTEKMIIVARNQRYKNQGELASKEEVGCFYCLEKFSSDKIVEWVKRKGEGTAICPCCGIDSVISLPFDDTLLKEMNEYWFAVSVPLGE